MKWQWAYGPTLLPWSIHTSEARLRLLASYDAKSDPSPTFCRISLLLDRLSKI